MSKRFAFDTPKAIATAWDVLWSDNLKRRAKDANTRWANRTYYLTAADIENQVRLFASDSAEGRPWDLTVKQYGRPCNGIRMPGDLQAMVRRWLFNNSALTHHNFGRGHISGARFRPVGGPIGPAEKETNAKLEKKRAADYVRPMHYGQHSGGRPLCQTIKAGARRFSYRPSKAWTSSTADRVTCKACKNALERKAAQ